MMWEMLYGAAFLAAFVGSAAFKLTYHPQGRKLQGNSGVGAIHRDLPCGPGEANRFDLYLPADKGRNSCGLVVYLHAGGFTSGDKRDDEGMLRYLCAKGFVAAGINYTLRNEARPEVSVYSQSLEIRESIPAVAAAAERLGYPLDRMAVGGGSAGGCLALLYAYRDRNAAPVPVKMVFEAVGPASFHHQDWTPYGLDRSPEAAAHLFSVMSGNSITPDMIQAEAYHEAVKNISAYRWVDERTVPTLCAYGAYDKVCPFASAGRLIAALEACRAPYDYIEFLHSGHGLQNDGKLWGVYVEKLEAYLERHMASP